MEFDRGEWTTTVHPHMHCGCKSAFALQMQDEWPCPKSIMPMFLQKRQIMLALHLLLATLHWQFTISMEQDK